MSLCLSCDIKRVAAASFDEGRHPITEAQSNICSIRAHSLFIHANTSILKKLNRVSSPSLTRGISRNIYQDLWYDSLWPLGLPSHTPPLTDRLWWIMGPDLYAEGCRCHFFMFGLLIMHDLGLECQEKTSHKQLQARTHTHTFRLASMFANLYMQTPAGIPLLFFVC